tara:strand:- start:1008 stop:1379 length:372 start_codon:yes stop_codon:yes gene_type:complete
MASKNSLYKFSSKLGMFILKPQREIKASGYEKLIHPYNKTDYASIVPDTTSVKVTPKMIRIYIDVLFSGDFHPLRDRESMNDYFRINHGWSLQQINEIKYQLDLYAKHFGLAEYLKEKRFSNE